MTPDLQSHPRLAPGCRLGENNQQRVLLMPERALRLNGPSLEIVQRCDGKHTVQQIIGELQQIYSKAEPKKVETDILDYLARLHDQRALDFAYSGWWGSTAARELGQISDQKALQLISTPSAPVNPLALIAELTHRCPLHCV